MRGTFGDQELHRIGRQVRDVRQGLGCTQAQVAHAAGLSLRSVRALEAGRSSPNLATMVAVARALAISLDGLIASARQEAVVSDYTAAPSKSTGRAELTRQLPGPRMRARIVTLGDTAQNASEHQGAMFGFVLEGDVDVAVERGAQALGKGDSIHAQVDVLGSWRAAAGTARVLVVEMSGPAGAGRPSAVRKLIPERV